jgi:hypothetical protein
MKRAAIAIAVVVLSAHSGPARAQSVSRPELLTHVSVGPVIAYRFGKPGSRGSWTLGVEVSPIHAFHGCSAYDPTMFVGIALGAAYAFAERRALFWAEAEVGYAMAFFTSGIGIGPVLSVRHEGADWGARATEFAGIFGTLTESWENAFRYQYAPLTKVPIPLVPDCGTFD